MSAIQQNAPRNEDRPRNGGAAQTSEHLPDGIQTIDYKEQSKSAPFGRRLGKLRIGGGLTQEALAEKAGLSVRGISDLERGIRLPRIDTINRIAQALGVEGSVLTSVPARKVDIPAALDAFIDRDVELAMLTAELRSGARLITIVGAPGVGKSRLAREIAASEEVRFEHGAALVRLCVLRNRHDFPGFLARQLGTESFFALQERLRWQRFLLVLDNIEHLPGIAEDIVTLLESAPLVTIICTGRKALDASGERIRELQPLALPESAEPEAILAAPSTRLFVTRVRERLAQPLSRADAPALARIVNALDGLPLALELAAMQMANLSLEDVARRTEDIVVAASGPTDHPLHSRSMAGSLEWSLATLDPDLRRFIVRLSVFVGTFSVEASAYVGNISREQAQEYAATLREMYLLVRTPEPRLIAMLGTVRCYLLAKLQRTGDFATARDRHAQWYVANDVAEVSAFEGFAPPIRALATRGLENNLRHARHTPREMLAFAKP